MLGLFCLFACTTDTLNNSRDLCFNFRFSFVVDADLTTLSASNSAKYLLLLLGVAVVVN